MPGYRTKRSASPLLNLGMGILLSLSLHAMILALFGYWIWNSQTEQQEPLLITVSESEPTDELLILETNLDMTPPLAVTLASRPIEFPLDVNLTQEIPLEHTHADAAGDDAATTATTPGQAATTGNQRPQIPATPGGLSGRVPEMRGELLKRHGGTARSENAVAAALEFLAAHQCADGGWRFDLKQCGCQDPICARDSGTANTTTGATGLALLPFLGAGHTPASEEYGETVRRGLDYLVSRLRETPYGGDLQEGTMYAHGIATVALCEAYTMTKDVRYRRPAQRAIEYICYAQHKDGGWRYFPKQEGDTTVFGWQYMALKSAVMAGLEVPEATLTRAQFYLRTVTSDQGVTYGYRRPGTEKTPTAVGLLARIYGGWDRTDSRLQRGVRYLVGTGVDKSDMYFNYYATQVLFHAQTPAWDDWNGKMQQLLLEEQESQGHLKGSWHFVDKHGMAGGRLYTTALCALTLEVYYRYLPLYDPAQLRRGFSS